MAKRTNHYDAAFEALLIATGRPFVSVDETRRARLEQVSLKSMDFIVDGGPFRLLVDVKGRRFTVGSRATHRWESWADEDDVASLLRWEEVFGSAFRAAFVFAYWITDPAAEAAHPQRFEFQGRVYAFYAVWVREYARLMRSRSPRWKTVVLPSGDYRAVRCSWDDFVQI